MQKVPLNLFFTIFFKVLLKLLFLTFPSRYFSHYRSIYIFSLRGRFPFFQTIFLVLLSYFFCIYLFFSSLFLILFLNITFFFFGFFYFHSPLLIKSRLISFPNITEKFQFILFICLVSCQHKKIYFLLIKYF